MTEPSRARRPNKAFLGRIKVFAIILSVVAFFGSLAGVAIANPATAKRPAQVVQPVGIGPASGFQGQPDNGNLFIPSPPQMPQMPRVRPLTRTRGS